MRKELRGISHIQNTVHIHISNGLIEKHRVLLLSAYAGLQKALWWCNPPLPWLTLQGCRCLAVNVGSSSSSISSGPSSIRIRMGPRLPSLFGASDSTSGRLLGTVSHTTIPPYQSSESSSPRGGSCTSTLVPSGRLCCSTPRAWLNNTTLRPPPPVWDEWKMIPSKRGSTLWAKNSATAWVVRYSSASSCGITGRLISLTKCLKNSARPSRSE